MNRTAMVAALVVAVAATAGGAWWLLGNRGAQESGPMALRPDDARLIARGADVYTAQCASCHGANLEGQPNWRERGPDGLLPAPPHDASGHTWHHPDALLIRITRDGVAAVAGDPNYRTSMPVYRDVLSDQDIVAALSWIKSRWPADVRSKHDQINARAR
ncbi:MAG: cytochrome c [Anaerolineae bacterium]|nr:cytochrome c [Anaerolineae bacterium]MCB0251956.1 cytochrome c [Anaerolineae bacterium]